MDIVLGTVICEWVVILLAMHACYPRFPLLVLVITELGRCKPHKFALQCVGPRACCVDSFFMCVVHPSTCTAHSQGCDFHGNQSGVGN